MNREVNWWPSYPMVRLLIAMAIGIMIYDPYVEKPMLLISLLTLLMIPFLLLRRKTMLPQLAGIRNLPVLLLFLCMGHHLRYLHDVTKSPYWLGKDTKPSASWLGRITTPTKAAKAGYQAEIELIAYRTTSTWHPVSGGILAYYRGSALQEGDTILFFRNPGLVPPAWTNTNGFWSHMGHRNIYHRVWLEERDWHLLAPAEKRRPALRARLGIKGILDSLFRDSTVRNMAGALLIGERTQLATDLKQAYIQTGVIHVIAISGMHLALIYAMLTGILRFLRHGRGKWIYTIVCLGLLWLYAWICGNTPSVLRSAWMFSFLLTGEALGKEQQTGNSLAAAAMVMLCVDPVLLYDLGFQLSYAAVASLLIYQQPIRLMYLPENQLLAYCWQLIATTLAAQVLTTPLILYHFGRFPILFLVTNLLAVPLSGVILLLLCIACLLYPMGCAGLPALISTQLIIFMNDRVLALASTTFAQRGNIHLSLQGLCTVYLLLITVTLWTRSKKR